MENFRDLQLGPDPFGRMWHVQFKYLQTAISIRHSDSVDVCFILDSDDEHLVRTAVIPHAEIRAFASRSGTKVTDALCSRIALAKLRYCIETGEDIDKEYLAVTPKEIEEFAAAIKKWEAEWLKSHAA